MYRNDTGLPFAALLAAVALYFAAWLDGRYAGQLAGKPLTSPTVAQIAMVTFATVLLVYGVIGYLSVWIDGHELRLGRRAPAHPSRVALLVAAVLILALVADAGLFVQLVVRASTTGLRSTLGAGAVSILFFLVAALLSIQRRFLMAREVVIEEAGEEGPW